MPVFNPKKAVLLKTIYLTFFLFAVLSVLGSPPYDLGLYRLGQIFGSLGLTAITLQMIMGARIRFIESGIGYPELLKVHALNGKLAFLFITLHPTLIIWDLNRLGQSVVQTILTFTIFHFLGSLAFLLIITTILLTVYQARIRLNYEHWKIIHKVGYLIVLLGFTHSFFVGTDINFRSTLFFWWLFLGALALSAFFYRYLYRPRSLKKSIFKVVKIIKEAKNIRSIYFSPHSGKIFSYAPGQFAFIRFFSPRLSSEEHHFTISSAPGDKYLIMTIKESGDFTQSLRNLRVGDKAVIEGPFGSFSNHGQDGPFVFIAGGIGITPIMSMLRAQAKSGKKDHATLFYSAKTPEDLVFKAELENLKKYRWLSVHYFFTETGGRLDAQLVQAHVKNLKNHKIFICGPMPMITSLEKGLGKLISNPDYIFTEKFALR